MHSTPPTTPSAPTSPPTALPPITPSRSRRAVLCDDAGTPARVVRDRTDTGPLKGLLRRLITSFLPIAFLGAIILPYLPIAFIVIKDLPRGTWTAQHYSVLIGIFFAVAVTAGAVLLVIREWLLRLDWELYTLRRSKNRCGVCGFDMQSAMLDPLGLGTCPECTARWRPVTPPRREPAPAPPSGPAAPPA